MKATNVILALLMLVTLVPLQAQTTINRSDIPVATYFYMPIGDRNSDIRNDLRWGFRPNTSSNPTQIFPGFNGVNNDGWYVATDFNSPYDYTGDDCYAESETFPNCNTYHPAEDWNGNGGNDTEEGEPIYAIAVGRVIFSGTAFGNTVIIVHRLPDNDSDPNNDELVASVYAHMQNTSTLQVDDLVYPTTQVGAVGNTGTTWAHLHWEIRQQSMLSEDVNHNISLDEAANHWPGTNTTFISSNYYDPTDFIKEYNLVGKYEDANGDFVWHEGGSDPSQPILNTYNEHGGFSFFGIPTDFGGGAYAHPWPDQGDPSSQDVVVLQDFEDASEVHRAIALSPGRTKAFYIEPPISDFWFSNTGYLNYGSPMTNPESGKYSGGVLGSLGDDITVQKFGKTDPQGSNVSLKTIAFNESDPDNTVDHYPMGKLTLAGSQGDTWYIDVDESGSVTGGDKELFTIGASGYDWIWIDEGSYILMIDPVSGSVNTFAHYVWEGNSQVADLGLALTVTNQITIESDPPEAEIWDDNVLLDPTPVYLFLGENDSKTLTAKLPGYYDKNFQVSWVDGGQTVTITLEPTSTGSGGSGGQTDLMSVKPGYLDFGLVASVRKFVISKETTAGDIDWGVSPSQAWISIYPAAGAGASNPGDTVAVTIDRSGLAGLYEENITIGSTAGTIYLPIVVDANSEFNSPQSYDFSSNSDLNDWTVIDRGIGQTGLSDDSLKLEHGGIGSTAGRSEAFYTAAGSIFSEVAMTFTLNNGVKENANQSSFVYLCYQSKDKFYYWLFNEDNRSGDGRTRVELVKVYPGGTELLYLNNNWELPSGTYTASYTNGAIALVDDLGGTVIDETITDSNPLTFGRVGFGVNEESTAFDDITVSGSTANLISTNKNSLNFGAEQLSRSLAIASLADDELSWWLDSYPDYLIPDVSSGSSPATVVFTADRDGLEVGEYADSIVIGSSGGSKTVAASLAVANVTFADDFNRAGLGSGYEVEYSASISGNELRVYDSPGDPPGVAVITATGSLLNDYLEFDWRQTFDHDNRRTYVYLNYTDDDNNYHLIINRDARYTQSIEINKVRNGNQVQLYSQNVSLAYGRYRLAARNDTLSFMNIDSTGTNLNVQNLTEAVYSAVPAGLVRFTVNEEEAFFDNIVIVDLDDTTPPVTSLIVDPDCDGPSFVAGGNPGWAKTENANSTISFSSSSPLSGSSSVLVENSQAGNNSDVMVEQALNLMADHDYQLTFLTKSSNAGPYGVSLDVYTTDTWQSQGGWLSFNLDGSRQSVSHTFTAIYTAPTVMWWQYGQMVGAARIDSVYLVDLTGGAAQNEAPTAVNDTTSTITNSAAVVSVASNDSDPEDELDLTSLEVVTDAANGATELGPNDGQITYTPQTSFTGLDSFSYTIKDDDAAESNTAWVFITVSELSFNLLHNGNAELNEALDQGDTDRWGAQPLSGASYVENSPISPISGSRSLKIVKAAGEWNSPMTRLLQSLAVDSGVTYVLAADLYNSSDISGSPYIDNYQVGGCWCNQGLWWNEELDTGLTHIETTFTPEITGYISLQFRWDMASGTSWIDNVSVTVQGGAQQSIGITSGNTDILPAAEPIPTRFALHQNFPNPFNPATQIKEETAAGRDRNWSRLFFLTY